jgi:dCTP deaminase
MPLADSSILKEMELGNIKIVGFTKERLNPASVDLTLSNKVKTFRRKVKYASSIIELPTWVVYNKLYFKDGLEYCYIDCLDIKNPNQEYHEYVMPDDGFVLMPNKGYLFACNETISVGRNLVARVDGKSSLGRYFVKIHETAGYVDPCFFGKLVLEVTCQEPIRIYPNIPICQLVFDYVQGKVTTAYGEKLTDKYQGQQGVQTSKYNLNFEK